MSAVIRSIDALVGDTPLLELVRIQEHFGLSARILAKLEYFNPAGSVKDRIARNILDQAEKDGRLKKGTVIIEPTSGNTGIGLAAFCAVRGYKLIIVMPESMSIERRRQIKAYGAEIVLTPATLGMKGAIEKAQALHESLSDSFIAGQFENPANPAAHYETTGPEIWRQTGGDIQFFIAGVGTGGTLTGAGSYLKARDPKIKIIALEPAASPVLSGGPAGPHKIQGIGAGFIPKNLDLSVVDEVMTIGDEEATTMARLLAHNSGILVGISSGAAICAAVSIGKANPGATLVAILPDNGDRYLSSGIYD